MARILIPENFEEQYQLFKKIYEKHLQDGSNSIFTGHFDIEQDHEKIIEAHESHTKAKEYERKAELETEKRNVLWPKRDNSLRPMAQFLKARYKKIPHELGEWGFTVDSSPQRKKYTRKPKAE